jgi:phosphoglycerate dehydrogenase-like enzyme
MLESARGFERAEAALAGHLKSCRLEGAAIDVYSAESPAEYHPLLKLQGETARRVLFAPDTTGVVR